MKIKNVIIIGPGLMGGSIAKALRKSKNIFNITAVCKNKSELLKIRKINFFDNLTITFNPEIFKSADLVVVCSPVSTIAEIINKISGLIKKDCIITDVGSIKYNIYKSLSRISAEKYIGSHPMTGSEKSGIENSDSSIFENAVVIITNNKETNKNNITELIKFWELLKCKIQVIDIKIHDLIVAYISHLPHLTASALVKTSGISFFKKNKLNILPFAGGGFKDSTRIAAGNPDLWTDIFFNNSNYVLNAIDCFLENVNDFKKSLLSNDKKKIRAYLSSSAKTRESLQAQVKRILKFIYEIVIHVEDKPGMIGKIAMILGKNKINIKYIEVLYVRENEPGSIKIGVNSQTDMERAYKILISKNYKAYKRD